MEDLIIKCLHKVCCGPVGPPFWLIAREIKGALLTAGWLPPEELRNVCSHRAMLHKLVAERYEPDDVLALLERHYEERKRT